MGDARADRYEAAVHTVLSDPNVDMGMIILTPQSMTEIPETASIVPSAIKGIDKPVVCSFMGARDVHDGVEILRKNGIPNYSFPEDAIKSLAAAHNLVELHEVPHRQIIEWKDLNVDRAKELIAEALGDKNERYLTQAECRPIFECYKLPLLKSSVVQTADEAALVAEEFACPVVMKVMSADVVHKFDAGGVLLNIQGADKAREGFARIHENVLKAVPGAKIDGILVEEMAKKGVEVILGASRDPRFGPLMMFGPRRHHGRGAEGCILPIGADVADLRRADGADDPLVQGSGRLPRNRPE
ncbi:MAG: acetate--CoA ligase family protein [Verrucomicrobiota bacterium]